MRPVITDSIEELQAKRNAAAETLASLAREREQLPAEIKALKDALLRDSSISPEETLATIQAKETRLKIVEVEAARAAGDRLAVEIDIARFRIPSLQDELARSFAKQDEASANLQAAQAAFEAAQKYVLKVQHDISSAERQTQQAENALAQHRMAARAAISA